MSIIKNYRLRLDAGNITPLIIHVNQYDKNEIWNFTLIDYQGNQYITTEAAIVGKKPDGCLIANNCTVSEGIVSVEVTEQMTAAAGKAVFELLVDGQLHGTANFIVMIERSPQDGAIESESDLSLFQQAIDATSTPAIIAGVQAWMDENLTPTTPVVDSSLSITGAAADAKKTGDEINDLKSALNATTTPAEVVTGKYINSLGAESTDQYYDCSGYIDISEFLKISFSGSLFDGRGAAFYKADKTTVLGYINGTNASDYGYNNTSVPQNIKNMPVPDGATYIRFTRRNSYPVTVNDFSVSGLTFSGLAGKVNEISEELNNIHPNAYVNKNGQAEVTVKNAQFLDTVWVNAFDGNYTDGYVAQGSVANGFTYAANAARYNLAIVPIKPSTKYTAVMRQTADGNIALMRVVSATSLMAVGGRFDGGVALDITGAANPYVYTFTTGVNDAYLYIYGINSQTATRPFIQVAEGEISTFTTDQYSVFYGVPNRLLRIGSNDSGIRIVPVSATRFNLKVLDTVSKQWMTHTFLKAHKTHTLSYGSGSTKTVVTSDVWYAEFIKDADGNNIMQGNTNFIHYLDNTGHQGHVGAGHGCAVAVYTLFFADGQLIDPTSLTGEVECSVFRMTEKVNHYLIDQTNTTSSSDAIPSLDENGDPIVESVEYLDAEWTINNAMKLRNRLDIAMDGLRFQQCFAGMLTGYYPYFNNIMINNPEYIYNELNGTGDNITITAKGGTNTVLSPNSGGYFDADEVILYGDKYRVSTRIIANNPQRNGKLNVETASMPPNYDSRIKAYFMPCVCTQSYPLIDRGETVETFNTGDILDVMIFKKLDVSA